MSELKKMTISIAKEVIHTLAEQGFIDVGPREGEYDLKPLYDFLAVSGIAHRLNVPKYWLRLCNEDACIALIGVLNILEEKR